MMNALKKRILTLGTCAMLALGASSTAAMAEFRGGGVVWGMTDACADDRWADRVEMVRARYRPREVFGGASSITLFFPWGGAVNFRSATDFDPGPTRWIARGYGVFGEFFGLERPRQRIRVLERSSIAPWQADFANADEIILQLRIGNYDGTSSSCFATVSLALARGD